METTYPPAPEIPSVQALTFPQLAAGLGLWVAFFTQRRENELDAQFPQRTFWD